MISVVTLIGVFACCAGPFCSVRDNRIVSSLLCWSLIRCSNRILAHFQTALLITIAGCLWCRFCGYTTSWAQGGGRSRFCGQSAVFFGWSIEVQVLTSDNRNACVPQAWIGAAIYGACLLICMRFGASQRLVFAYIFWPSGQRIAGGRQRCGAGVHFPDADT